MAMSEDEVYTYFVADGATWREWMTHVRSTKRGILAWIPNGKRPSTRAKWIEEMASLAAQNIHANQYRPK